MSFVAFPNLKPQDEERATGTDYADSLYLQIVDEETCEREWSCIEENIKKYKKEISDLIVKNSIALKENHFQGKLLFQVAKEIGGEQVFSKGLF